MHPRHKLRKPPREARVPSFPLPVQRRIDTGIPTTIQNTHLSINAPIFNDAVPTHTTAYQPTMSIINNKNNDNNNGNNININNNNSKELVLQQYLKHLKEQFFIVFSWRKKRTHTHIQIT
ncbi:uncharacterized protein LOC142225172 [Haematobia irritans]|uniref:uncharacterized protein LOC142225172 n=1 Tax=Haematobia irritans TaxID=7368 RepID=UPI003F4FD6C9